MFWHDGVEAELLLQECPLAEQALVRLVVRTPQRAVEDVEEGVASRARSLARSPNMNAVSWVSDYFEDSFVAVPPRSPPLTCDRIVCERC